MDNAQLAVENAGKAALALFGITPKTHDPAQFGADRETIRLALEAENIEARPVWKPMHLQPIFQGCETVGGPVAESLFRDGHSATQRRKGAKKSKSKKSSSLRLPASASLRLSF